MADSRFGSINSNNHELHTNYDENQVEDEIQVLEAIYIRELTISRKDSGCPYKVSVLIHPATADDPEKQYVCLNLVLTLNDKYPDEIPTIEIKNPRGLPDEEIITLAKRLNEHASENKGNPMMYELIEMSKELLTDSNIPHCPCVVCLEHFHSDCDFTKTPCYHYLHTYCLQRYMKYCLDDIDDEIPLLPHQEKKVKEVLCPVCREPITSCVNELINNPVLEEPVEDILYKPSQTTIARQKQMAKLFEKQKSRGSIIDVEEESKKFLLTEGEVVSMSVPIMDPVEHSRNHSARSHRNRYDHRHNKNYSSSNYTSKQFSYKSGSGRPDSRDKNKQENPQQQNWRDRDKTKSSDKDRHKIPAKQDSAGSGSENVDNLSSKVKVNKDTSEVTSSLSKSKKTLKLESLETSEKMENFRKADTRCNNNSMDNQNSDIDDTRKFENKTSSCTYMRGRGAPRRRTTYRSRGYSQRPDINSDKSDDSKSHLNEIDCDTKLSNKPVKQYHNHYRGGPRGQRGGRTYSKQFQTNDTSSNLQGTS